MTPHCPYFSPGLFATLHMAALPGENLIEHLYHDLAASPFAAAIQPRHVRSSRHSTFGPNPSAPGGTAGRTHSYSRSPRDCAH